ncbi:hypothetical protein MCHI_000615 [Candidatus Magnetoovum chiemensis]|nr:hypothetical protein MCHI_000615 [Candidatus Magnetoovum chiemensis]
MAVLDKHLPLKFNNPTPPRRPLSCLSDASRIPSCLNAPNSRCIKLNAY